MNSELEKLVELLARNPSTFQMELDYMYLDSISQPLAFLEKVQKLFGGELPQEKPWQWEELANDSTIEWRKKIAEIVFPVAEKVFVTEVQREIQLDRLIESEYECEQMETGNLSGSEIEDRGMLRCESCGHILTHSGGDWMMCSDHDCSCPQCAKRIVEA